LKPNLIAGLLILAFVVTGCGENNQTAVPATRPPTAIPPTPTPRSTPLPDVPEMPSLGDSRRPVGLVFVLPDGTNETRANTARTHLESYFSSQGITVDIQFAENDAAAFQAVCGGSGNPAAVWASSFTVAQAQIQCDGIPALAVTRGQRTRASVGTTVDLVARAGIIDISGLAGQVFCRIDAQDFDTWVLPRLIMQSQGLNPMTDLAAVMDFEDSLEMLRAIYDGDCAAAAIPAGEFDDLLDELADSLDTEEQPVTSSDLTDKMMVIVPAGDTDVPDEDTTWEGYATNVVPYEGLVFPPNYVLPATLRAQMTDAIVEFSAGRNGSELLTDLLDAVGIIRIDSTDYETFSTMLSSARWDMIYNG
jgi:ABC-type phosphate/phosphonate transport system substrate-binding protein